MMMTHGYDSVLVILSVVIAILASYAALNLAAQVTTAEGSTRWGWLAGGAIVMGLGIWSMHFVGMLAFHLPVPIEYALPLMLLSVAVAIAASLLALYVVSRIAMSVRTLLSAGLLMGVAIAGMHYIGMASINVAARLTYSVPYVVASIVIAIAASVAALWLAFRFRTDAGADAWIYKVFAAVVMGAAITGMHYTAMAGARFAPGPMRMSAGSHFLATDELGQAIAVGTLLMIVLAIIGTAIDRHVLKERVGFTDRLVAQTEQLGLQKEELTVQAEELTVQAEELEAQATEQRLLNDELQVANRNLQDAVRVAERAQQAEREANQLRTKFVNMASHELRTPLGAIGGYVQLLQMGIHGPLSEAQLGVLQRIDINQKHVLRLINEMLELAKLEAGQMKLHLGELELHEILEAARPMVEPQMEAKHITYSREFAEQTPKVIGDPERVQQILINLLANSIKFTPASGTISVSACCKGNTVELRVTDSGPGIPSEKVKTLFAPFMQLGVVGEKYSGTGLGLAISRELARAMGGDLGVDGNNGAGATFVLSLNAVNTGVPASVH